MLRVVVDPGAIISALISPRGAPAELLRRWMAGSVQFIWSDALIAEFDAVCARPRFREWFEVSEAIAVSEIIRRAGEYSPDIDSGAPPPADESDGYLIDLALSARADCLVTGDAVILNYVQPGLRIVTPRAVIDLLDALDGLEQQ